MSKLRLATIVGTRPEIIKLAQTIKLADKHFDHTLIHTGQNWDYTLNEIFFEELGLRKPDYFLEAVGDDLGQTVGNIIATSYKTLSEIKPDAVLILGDTNSALSAISAKRLKIPIFHMEAGNRCFDENLPEEINRRIVDHIADVNLPYTEHARRYLISEGIRQHTTFVTGSPMPEILDVYSNNINQSDVLKKLQLEPGEYFLVSAHREENIDDKDNFKALVDSLNKIAEKYEKPIVFSTHPRTRKKLEAKNVKLHSLIRDLKPFGFFDYNHLQKNALCVLSDSGTLAEESSILEFSSVSLRTSTERPEVLDKGSFIVGGVAFEDVFKAIELSTTLDSEDKHVVVRAENYQDKNVSTKILKIIQSYTHIINSIVWKK